MRGMINNPAHKPSAWPSGQVPIFETKIANPMTTKQMAKQMTNPQKSCGVGR
jgi:hypothetical protein